MRQLGTASLPPPTLPTHYPQVTAGQLRMANSPQGIGGRADGRASWGAECRAVVAAGGSPFSHTHTAAAELQAEEARDGSSGGRSKQAAAARGIPFSQTLPLPRQGLGQRGWGMVAAVGCVKMGCPTHFLPPLPVWPGAWRQQ